MRFQIESAKERLFFVQVYQTNVSTGTRNGHQCLGKGAARHRDYVARRRLIHCNGLCWPRGTACVIHKELFTHSEQQLRGVMGMKRTGRYALARKIETAENNVRTKCEIVDVCGSCRCGGEQVIGKG